MAAAKKPENQKSTALEIPFHMNEQKKTEMYVKFAKTMVFFQGAYTEKRSQLLQQLKKTFKTASLVISDETYRSDYQTACSSDTTVEYYKYFRCRTKKALEEGNNLIVLDPTMTNKEETAYYLALAHKMQYVFFVFPPVVINLKEPIWPPKSQAESFFKAHKTIIDCSNRFKHLFCAWYLHDIDSIQLRDTAMLFVDDCLTGIPEFRSVFTHICPFSSDDKDDYSDEPPQCTTESFRSHFRLHDQRQDLAYCVVKIFQGMRSMSEYFKEEAVMRSYGKMSKLLVAGFVVSPHMVAARIKLSHNQRELWDMPDYVDEDKFSRLNLACASELAEQSKADLPEVEVRLTSSKSNQTLVNTGNPVHKPLDVFYPNARARSCHVVLGKAKGAAKRNVDYDVAFALKRENCAKDNAEISELENCVVKRLGKYWIIYLREMYSVDGFFASCCKPYAFENPINS